MSQGNKAVLTLAVFLETMKALVSGSEPLDAGAHMRQGSKLCIAAGAKRHPSLFQKSVELEQVARIRVSWTSGLPTKMNRLVLLPQWRLREALA